MAIYLLHSRRPIMISIKISRNTSKSLCWAIISSSLACEWRRMREREVSRDEEIVTGDGEIVRRDSEMASPGTQRVSVYPPLNTTLYIFRCWPSHVPTIITTICKGMQYHVRKSFSAKKHIQVLKIENHRNFYFPFFGIKIYTIF